MKKLFGHAGTAKSAAFTALVLVMAGQAMPAIAQDTLLETRIRSLEAEIRALQRKVFPGGDAKLFAPEITPATTSGGTAAGSTQGTPVSDLLSRMDSVEGQLKRMTAQVEENSNKLTQLETRLNAVNPPATATAAPAIAPTPAPVATPATPAVAVAPVPVPVVAAPAPAPSPAPAATPKVTDTNLAAMTGGASSPKPAAKPATAAAPSAQRLAAVRAIAKPQTDDPGDDEYSYGFRLWEAKFFPEAQQQLKLMIDKYPRHPRVSFARNLLGRAYLDDGKPRDAATWFLQNYQAGKTGERAADSLLYLAESMRQLKDTSRSCIALGEFATNFPREAAGRLKTQYDATRGGVKCN